MYVSEEKEEEEKDYDGGVVLCGVGAECRNAQAKPEQSAVIMRHTLG